MKIYFKKFNLMIAKDKNIGSDRLCMLQHVFKNVAHTCTCID